MGRWADEVALLVLVGAAGATFKVGETTDLAAFDPKREAFQYLLQQIEDAENHVQDLCAERNAKADELYKLMETWKRRWGGSRLFRHALTFQVDFYLAIALQGLDVLVH